MNSAHPLTTAIPSPTLSLNFGDIAASKRASTATSPAPTSSSLQPPQSLGPPTTTTRTLHDVALEMRDKVARFLDGAARDDLEFKVKAQVRASMDIIEEALARYGPDHLALSYNGGKDCLVLLILILACLPTWEASATNSAQGASPAFPASLQAFYVISHNPFSEVQSFVATTAHEYRIDLASFTDGMRSALCDYLAERPKVRAVFVGTRRTDPHGADLTHFDPTDEGWPACMRVHPVIDWHYAEIWAFIRALEIPFCKLYDLGYTSLGGMNDTRPNPALAADGSFKPAYELKTDDQERLGRDSNPSAPTPGTKEASVITAQAQSPPVATPTPTAAQSSAENPTPPQEPTAQ